MDIQNLDFAEYVKGRNNLLAQEVAAHINNMAPPEKERAIQDMADILRHYSDQKYGNKSDTRLWNDLQNDPITRKDFVGEAVRQLAHYSNENTNSETGYLKSLNPNTYAGRTEFYKQKVFQTDLNEFGPQLRDLVRRVAERVKSGK